MAQDADSLEIISALVQDAVFPAAEMKWRTKARDFAILLNRFRWEDKERAEARGRPYERVQSVLRGVLSFAKEMGMRIGAESVESSWSPAGVQLEFSR